MKGIFFGTTEEYFDSQHQSLKHKNQNLGIHLAYELNLKALILWHLDMYYVPIPVPDIHPLLYNSPHAHARTMTMQ